MAAAPPLNGVSDWKDGLWTCANQPAGPLDTRAALAVFFLMFALLASTAPTLLADGDTFWHLRTGQEILDRGHFPTTDSYSYTMAGQPWIAKEWLSQILLAGVFRLAGFDGIVFLALAFACAAYALAFGELERRLGLVFAFAMTLVIAWVCNYHLLARPHVFAWPVLVLWTIMLLRAAERRWAPPLGAALLMSLWANLHGSFLLGLIVAPFFAIESIVGAQDRRARVTAQWAAFGAASLLAPMLHPYGFGVYKAAWQVLNLGPSLAVYIEWRPQNFSVVNHFEIVLLAGLAGALVLRVKMPAPRIALLLLLLHSALAHVRQESLFVLIAPLLLAGPLAARLSQPPLHADGRRAQFGLALCIALALASSFLVLRQGPIEPPAEVAPVKALAAARAAGVSGPVLNEDTFGGFLIANDVKTYADDRAELYGRKFHRDLAMALALRDRPALEKILSDNDFGWALLPSNLPAVREIESRPGWTKIYADETATALAHKRVP